MTVPYAKAGIARRTVATDVCVTPEVFVTVTLLLTNGSMSSEAVQPVIVYLPGTT